MVEDGPVERIFAAARHEYTRALLDAIPGRELFDRSQAQLVPSS